MLARDAQPILRRQHLEIGGADAGDRGEHDDFLGEAGGDGGFLRGARGGAVLAPEIDLVGGIERDPVVLAHRAAGRPRAGRAAGEIERRQQRRAGDLARASACMMRPMAAPMSRLAVCASSISLVSSAERKPRHQSSAGGADTPRPAR